MPELTSATLACRRVIVAALLADPVVSGTVGARIYRGLAPLLIPTETPGVEQAPPYPYITVGFLSPQNTYSGGVLIVSRLLFLVLLVGATEAQQETCVPAMLNALIEKDDTAPGAQLGTALGVNVSLGVNEGDYADEPTLPTGAIVFRSGARLRFPCQNLPS